MPPHILILYPPALSPLSDLDKVPVNSLLAHQLLMGALLDDFAAAHHQNQVCLADGGQAVGDQERGAARQQG